MAIVATDDRYYSEIADAIRTRLNGEDKYTPMEMANGVHTVCDYQYYQGRMEGEEVGHAIGLEDGKREGRDAVWDIITNKGQPQDYSSMFKSGRGWTDENFTPNNPLVLKSADMMFYGNRDITQMPVAFDSSQCTSLSYMFCTSGFRALPVIDFRAVGSAKKVNSAVYAMPNLVSIEKVYLHGGDVGDSFERNEKLVEIRCEGEFVSNVNMQWSPLSVESMKSIISCLKNFTGTDKEFAYTLTFSEDCWTALNLAEAAPIDNGAWQDYVYSLGWNAA